MRTHLKTAVTVCTALLLAACGSQNTSSTTTPDQASATPSTTVSTTESTPAQDPTQDPSATSTAAGASAGTQNNSDARRHECDRKNLNVTLSDPDGAAGSTYYEISVINKGSDSCTMSTSSPYVTGRNKANTQIGKPFEILDGSAKPVTLKPQATATSIMQVTNAANYQNCAPKQATQLAVSLTQGQDPWTFPVQISLCTSGEQNVNVQPFVTK
ncbi:MAG: DUF4232 domain-containing protein [Actinomycetaceae bacterium]|nr:DUF4232 domain-containing protein [Actinomycetaceae bacterium]MDY6082398.1 DUF4232 domain-containing protein [Actinomycetaceae bacterium]